MSVIDPVSGLPVPEPDPQAYASEFQGPQEPMPNDFFSRLAMQTGGQGPFGTFNPGRHISGAEGLAAFLGGLVNAKTRGAAYNIGEAKSRNQRASEAASTLARFRHEERLREMQSNAALQNIKASKEATAAAKPTPEEKAREAYLAEQARLRALREAGGKPPGAADTQTESAYATDTYITRNNNPWMDLTNYAPKEKAAAKDYAAKHGLFPADKGVADRLRAIEETYSNFDQIENFANQYLPDTQNAVRTGLAAGKHMAQAAFQTNPDLAAYQKNIQLPAIRNIQALAGGMGSGFRLTEAEVARAIANIPTIRDNRPTALRKLAWERSFLANKERTWFQHDWRRGAGVQAPSPNAGRAVSGEVVWTRDANGNPVPGGP